MMSPETALEVRIFALERRCRRQSIALAGLGAALLTTWLAAAASPGTDVIEARQFVLLGPDGKARGRWNAGATGSTLMLRNAAATSYVVLATGSEDGSPPAPSGESEPSAQVTEPVEEEQPWGRGPGLRAWTTRGEENARVFLTTPVAGSPDGLEIESGESSAAIAVTPEVVQVSLEGGADPYGVTTLFASGLYSGVDATCNDERTIRLYTDAKQARLELSRLDWNNPAWNPGHVVDNEEEDEEAEQEPKDTGVHPIVELHATDDAGSIRVHDGDRVIFEKP
jgi:hypothetical protein